jgi:hypothetical protein
MKKLYQGQVVEVTRPGQKNTRVVFPDGKDTLVPTEELQDLPIAQEPSLQEMVSEENDKVLSTNNLLPEAPLDVSQPEQLRDESGYVMLNTSNYDAPGAAMSRRLGPVLHQQENPQYRSPKGVMPSHAKNHK